MAELCSAELFIDGPVAFECDLESGHAAQDIVFSGGVIPDSAGDQIIHSSSDKTADGAEYQVRWVRIFVIPAPQ